MGCWCETDGITQLPINAGDKVRLFVLMYTNYEPHGGGTTYSNDIWRPLGSVQGTYDDYGSIENIVDDFSAKLLLADFKKNWSEDITLNNALHYIEREDGVDYNDKDLMGKSLLGVMMVLEDVYQAMIKFNPIVAEYYDDHKYLYKPSHDVLKNSIKHWYENFYKKYHETNKPFLWMMNNDILFDFRDKFTSLYKNFLISCIKNGKLFEDYSVQEACNSLVEVICFNNSMNAARKMWIPQTGKGAQHNELAIYKIIANTINEISNNRDKKMLEAGDWDMFDKNGYTSYMLEHNKKNK